MNVVPSESIARRTLHEELAERVSNLISMGELAPGQKIPEKELCERFGVSRTPLREALKVLASVGTVTLKPNRGAIVSVLTAEELDEALPVMGALEALTGALACEHITDEEIERVRMLHEQMVLHWRKKELQPYFRVNQMIHETILEATRNEVLKTVYHSVSRRVGVARYVASMSPARWARAIEEHKVILEAVEARDGKGLSKILKSHLAQKVETVKEWLHASRHEGQAPAKSAAQSTLTPASRARATR